MERAQEVELDEEDLGEVMLDIDDDKAFVIGIYSPIHGESVKRR